MRAASGTLRIPLIEVIPRPEHGTPDNAGPDVTDRPASKQGIRHGLEMVQRW
jgi:hypothetical protein